MMNQQCVMSASLSDNTRNRYDVKLLALCREDENRMSVVGIFPDCSAGYAEATEELWVRGSLCFTAPSPPRRFWNMSGTMP